MRCVYLYGIRRSGVWSTCIDTRCIAEMAMIGVVLELRLGAVDGLAFSFGVRADEHSHGAAGA